jgi:hypothetical protein
LLHFVTAVDSSSHPTNAGAATVINAAIGAGLSASVMQASIQAAVGAHMTPQCAMQVSRSQEVAPGAGDGLASYQPPLGCGCYYESLVNGGNPYSAYCKSCAGNSNCDSAHPQCNFGFCETQ